MWRPIFLLNVAYKYHDSFMVYTCRKKKDVKGAYLTWWRHQMETFSALLATCAVPGEFPAQRPVTRSFDVFFDLRLNKWLSKQSWRWWFETLSCPLWRHFNETCFFLAFWLSINMNSHVYILVHAIIKSKGNKNPAVGVTYAFFFLWVPW